MDKLDGDRAKTVEAGLAYFQQVQQERDDSDRELNKQLELVVRLRAQIDALHQQNSMLESRVAACEAARDQAIAERAVYEVLFISIKAQIDAFDIPAKMDNMEERREETTGRSQDLLSTASLGD